MRLLITGAFGNIGREALRELRRRGHEVRTLGHPRKTSLRLAYQYRAEPLWGEVNDAEMVWRAVRGQDAVIHLAAVHGPEADADPGRARTVNLEGTQRLMSAMNAQPRPPWLVFASCLEQRGPNHHKPACEQEIRASRLQWSILRFGAIPSLLGEPDASLFERPLDQRVEWLHPSDAGLAIANALDGPDIWGKTLRVAGGPRCEILYRDYVRRALDAMGIGMLPDDAFAKAPAAGVVGGDDAAPLLRHQRHSQDDMLAEIEDRVGAQRYVNRIFRFRARKQALRLSRYWPSS